MPKLVKTRKDISSIITLMLVLAILVCAGVSVLISLGITNLLAIDRSNYDTQVIITKWFIAILGFICALPLVLELKKSGILQIEFFSPTIVFPLLYFAVFGLGSLGLVASGNERVLDVVGCSIVGILFYYIGVVIVKILHDLAENKNALSRITIDWDPYMLKLVIAVLVTVSIAALVYHVLKAGLPIFYADLEEKRGIIKGRVSNYIVFLMRLITPAFFLYFANALLYKKVQRAFITIFFCFGLLLLVSLANRHDIFTFLLGALLIYNFSRRKIKLSKLLPILLIGLACVMAIGYYRLATLSYVTPEKELLSRIAGNNPVVMFFTYVIAQFTNYPLNFSIYLESFPKILPFEWGYSFIRAVNTAILPGHHGLFDEYVKAELGLDFLGGGINPTLLGELYANFGYAGLCGMSVYGAIITYLFYKAVKNRNGISVVAYAYGLSSLLLGLIGGFFSFSLPFYYIIVIAFAHLLMRQKKVQNIESQIKHI